ncbi:MAG: hypothetical protein QOF43_255, partial [Gaiellaceae bacterium]|nr:hypothetical protein [Gaiellaceae bacterium]
MFVFPRSALLAAAAFAALAVLVSTGACTGLDQWAVDHVMPGADFRRSESGLLEAVVPLLHQRWDGWLAALANIVTLPAAALVSLAILIYCR